MPAARHDDLGRVVADAHGRDCLVGGGERRSDAREPERGEVDGRGSQLHPRQGRDDLLDVLGHGSDEQARDLVALLASG